MPVAKGSPVTIGFQVFTLTWSPISDISWASGHINYIGPKKPRDIFLFFFIYCGPGPINYAESE
uniref:Uncharacterized protein n=1 Tax=Oryza glumipatula TaxID=40148 RepID=A0A0E0ABY0_9ORYZ